MFNAARLVRESWASVNDLAMELFAMFQNDTPLTQDAPVTFNGGSKKVAPIQVTRDATNTDPYTSYKQGQGTPSTTSPNNYGGLTVSSPAIAFTDENGDVVALGCLPGQVKSGSGTDYIVTVYQAGKRGPGITVNVEQLNVDPNGPIPPGKWALVCKVGYGTDIYYYMDVPFICPDIIIDPPPT